LCKGFYFEKMGHLRAFAGVNAVILKQEKWWNKGKTSLT